MFDLSNLNDYEFEILCKDMMQEQFKIKLYTFSRGIDAGVDICDKEKEPTVIIQAKHYVNSTYSQLKSSLKAEIPKMQKLKPLKYYVCTSQSLSRKNKQEIVDLFMEYMPDISFVIDKNDINSFLENEQNKDIVLKNYKLWLCASDVLSLVNNQNVFIDCAELMLDIEEQIKVFVETKAYDEAIKKLEEDNIIIIIGAPGVGKSTISKMILLYYANKEYAVRYVTNNNISDIKRTLTFAPEKKEIVLLDDFLGQHYLKLNDSQPNELKTLISFVVRSNNKKLILNSRVTILNEATQTFLAFNELMIKFERNKYLLDLDKMLPKEKAKILYNHLFFNELPQAYFLQVKQDENYLKLIKHKNYNPRIVEYVTRKHNYNNVPFERYFQYIIDKLNNPEDVWKDEFRNRLDTNDRILMNTIYSLSDTMIVSETLERAFNKRISKEMSHDTSLNHFNDTVTRLTDSLIKIVVIKDTRMISVINPSVNEYLYSEITSNTNEQISIIENALYFEQVFRALKSDTTKAYFRDKMSTYNYLDMNTLMNNSFFYFLKSVVEMNILDISLKSKVVNSLEQAYQTICAESVLEYDEIMYILYVEEYFKFYNLYDTYLSPEKMKNILKPLTISGTIKLINAIVDSYDDNKHKELEKVFEENLVQKITFRINNELHDKVGDAVFDVLRQVSDDVMEDYLEDGAKFLEDYACTKLEVLAYKGINKYVDTIHKIKIKYSDIDINIEHHVNAIRVSLRSVLRENQYIDNERDYSEESDSSLIKFMFER
jgi:hypothetical protein